MVVPELEYNICVFTICVRRNRLVRIHTRRKSAITDIRFVVSSWFVNIIVNIWENMDVFYTNVPSGGYFYVKISKAVK
jgi:hypothetical protein